MQGSYKILRSGERVFWKLHHYFMTSRIAQADWTENCY